MNDDDLVELFGSVDHFSKATVKVNEKSGRSTGKAIIEFQRRGAAEKFIEQYQNVKLDGRPMSLKLVGEQGMSTQSTEKSRERGVPTFQVVRGNAGRRIVQG